MTYSPLSLSKRHVLGDIYSRCDSVESVPVYLSGDAEPELLGHADEGLGHYADAISFHLSEENCKKLSSGNFTFSFEYDVVVPEVVRPGAKRYKLSSIILNARKAYQKPIPRRGSSEKAIAAALAAEAVVEA